MFALRIRPSRWSSSVASSNAIPISLGFHRGWHLTTPMTWAFRSCLTTRAVWFVSRSACIPSARLWFWSAVDGGHVPFVVAFAGGGSEVVEPFDLFGAQLDAIGGGVLLDAGDPLGAGDRGDVVALGE